MIRILESKDIGGLLARRGARMSEAEAVVRPILEAVRTRGDRALLEYARQFVAIGPRWPTSQGHLQAEAFLRAQFKGDERFKRRLGKVAALEGEKGAQ